MVDLQLIHEFARKALSAMGFQQTISSAKLSPAFPSRQSTGTKSPDSFDIRKRHRVQDTRPSPGP